MNNKELLLQRLNHVIDTITNNPFEKYNIDELSKIACISKFHFHRLFALFYGVNIYELLIYLRLKNAAEMLIKDKNKPITEIAFDCNYASSQAFTKSFRGQLGQSPSEFRKNPYWENFSKLTEIIKNLGHANMNNDYEITIEDFPETNIAALPHYGQSNNIIATIGKFIEWRKGNKLHPQKYLTYNIFHNPSDDNCAIHIGCEYSGNITLGDNMQFETIPANKCASLKIYGDAQNLEKPANGLYQWVIENNYKIADYPLFCKRVLFPPFTDMKNAETIIYLPIL